ncbi:DUF5723 family protein [Zunongwangia sp. F363]|uniref:DUF5723 family protein n=1 Tax=Autumnicola tepida TaxID=3075595 RepID=A0ABU3CES4_9FLAO|nr:DUF5723 family protein [Zunongwangia sp. F363]MDT0644806.1 DUF5723 family protein [Zunongwangia sp. F363]
MRRLLVVIFLLLFKFSFSQNKPLLYNVDALPQSLMSNPGAEINFRGHVGIPFFSQIHFAAGSTGVTLFDIFDDSNPNVNLRVRNAIRNLTPQDYFSVNEQWEILSLGWKLNRRDYLSVGLYQETDVFSYFPKDLAILVNEGNSNYINQPFDFSQASFTAEVLAVYHIGYNRQINDRLTVGARAKLYSGIFNVESTDNEGVFITTFNQNGNGIYTQNASLIDVMVKTSGFASLSDEEDNTVDQAALDLLKRSLLGGNIGVGLDIGATYNVTEQFQVTGAVSDIGVMFQRSDVENYHYYGDYQTQGLEPLFPEVENNEEAIPYWDLFEDEVDENLQDETLYDPYTTWRPIKFNTSMEFGFGRAFVPCNYRLREEVRYMNSVGVLFSGVNRPRGITMAFSAYYDKLIKEKFGFRAMYSVDKYSLANLGLMAHRSFGNFNVYLAVNNLLAFANLAKANSTSLQFGLQLIFDKRKGHY